MCAVKTNRCIIIQQDIQFNIPSHKQELPKGFIWYILLHHMQL